MAAHSRRVDRGGQLVPSLYNFLDDKVYGEISLCCGSKVPSGHAKKVHEEFFRNFVSDCSSIFFPQGTCHVTLLPLFGDVANRSCFDLFKIIFRLRRGEP